MAHEIIENAQEMVDQIFLANNFDHETMTTEEVFKSRDRLARLLARENLSVVFSGEIETAAMDVNDRVLYLPLLKTNLPKEVADLFVGHEIAHALITPPDAWDEWREKDANFLPFLNIVEDIRIDEYIQKEFPGLARDYTIGATYLFKSNFFQFDKYEEGVEGLPLVDRINLLHKVNHLTGKDLMEIPFSDEEMPYVNRMDGLKTWEDVVALAKDIYEFDKKNGNLDKMKTQKIEITLQGFESSDTAGHKGDEPKQPDINSITAQYFDESFKKELDTGTYVAYVDIPEVPYDKLVVPWNVVYDQRLRGDDRSSLSEYKTKHKHEVSHIVNEYERKKSAARWANRKKSNTGTLDMKKMFSYRYNQEIFKNVEKVQKGRNHGFIIVLDFSGSMDGSRINGVICQMIDLVQFCQRCNVKFRVYGFSDSIRGEEYEHSHELAYDEKRFVANPSCVNLVEILSNRMPKHMLDRAMSYILKWSASSHSYYSSVNSYLSLGGTPLSESFIVTPVVYDRFMKEENPEIVSIIYMTDGGGGGLQIIGLDGHYGNDKGKSPKHIILRDKLRNKEIFFQNPEDVFYESKGPIRYLQHVTGRKVINFDLDPYTYHDTGEISLPRSLMGSDAKGYDLLIQLSTNKFKDSYSGTLEDKLNNSSTEHVGKVYQASGDERKKTKVILTKMIDLVS